MRRPSLSRRGFLAAVASATSAGAAGLFHAWRIEPFWLDVHERVERFPDFHPSLSGLRIAHLTDIHIDLTLDPDYPREIARRVREEIKPDLVAFTGDLTTHSREHLPVAAQWLASFGVPTVACLGNHDYDPETSARVNGDMSLADELEALVRGTGVEILRNRSVALHFPSREAPLYVAGVEDFYTGRTDAALATRSIPAGGARLMLLHNPDAWRQVDTQTDGGLILAGHSHGGQIRVPLVGPLLLPIRERDKAAGAFRLNHSRMYVSRGLGRLMRLRFNCRPELPIHRIIVPTPSGPGVGDENSPAGG